MNRNILVVLAAFVVACGPSSKEPEHAEHEHAEGEHHGEHGEHGEGHHPKMEGAVKDFHDVVAPIFHGEEKDAARGEKACTAAPSFKEKAAAVQTESASKSEGAKKAAADLVAAVTDLESACAAAGKPDADAKFLKLHDAFHAVMEAK